MTRLPHPQRLWWYLTHAVLILPLLLIGACGTGKYNDRMERRIQEIQSQAAEQPDESDESAAEDPEARPDESDDELLEDEVPELNEPVN